jgi:hypothetical protein
MSGKTTLVTLQNDSLGVTEDFEISHAERLLRMQNNGGWFIPQTSKYEFNGYDINIRANQESGSRTEEQAGNSESESAAGQD